MNSENEKEDFEKLTGWPRAGDIGFKLFLVVLYAASAVMFSKNVEIIRTVWEISGLWIALAIGLSLAETLPLLAGLLLRRNWARQLLMIILVLSFFHNLWFNYWGHPFSQKNSLSSIIATLIGTILIIWLCKSRWFSKYMCNQGHKIWLWISLGAQVVIIISALGIAGSAYLWTGKHPVKQVPLPAFSVEAPLPEGWRETEAFGYIIPVPAEGTNDYTTYDDGDAAYSFKQLEGTNLVRLAWMTAFKPLYKCFDFAGVTTLERHYQQSYVKRFSVLYTMRHWIRPDGLSCAGFRTESGLDLMYELSKTQTMSFAGVHLEDPVTKEYHELFLGNRPPWDIDEQLKLISRIRKAEQ